jgi:hypothetical protein
MTRAEASRKVGVRWGRRASPEVVGYRFRLTAWIAAKRDARPCERFPPEPPDDAPLEAWRRLYDLALDLLSDTEALELLDLGIAEMDAVEPDGEPIEPDDKIVQLWPPDEDDDPDDDPDGGERQTGPPGKRKRVARHDALSETDKPSAIYHSSRLAQWPSSRNALRLSGLARPLQAGGRP